MCCERGAEIPELLDFYITGKQGIQVSSYVTGVPFLINILYSWQDTSKDHGAASEVLYKSGFVAFAWFSPNSCACANLSHTSYCPFIWKEYHLARVVKPINDNWELNWLFLIHRVTTANNWQRELHIHSVQPKRLISFFFCSKQVRWFAAVIGLPLWTGT
jgi:hypothetical protein